MGKGSNTNKRLVTWQEQTLKKQMEVHCSCISLKNVLTT